MANLPESFREYLTEAFGREKADRAIAALGEPCSAFIRLNPFKQAVPPPAFLQDAVEVPWSKWSRKLSGRPVFTLHPLFHCGAYYVQDSSSAFVGEVFRRALETVEIPAGRPLRVLDLCAAPGGKTTDMAASLREKLGDGFILVANEVNRLRCQTLSENVALWGDPNVVVTNREPGQFRSLRSFFDIILTDVPCSGEGMFRKDENAVKEWSVDAVEMCAARQRRILGDVWPALADGGLLLYSTCTFNRYENDGNVEWMQSELGAQLQLPDMRYDGILCTAYGYSLVPGFVPGEGQFCSLLRKAGLRKTGAASEGTAEGQYGYMTDKSRDRRAPLRPGKAGDASLKGLKAEMFTVPVHFEATPGGIRALPQSISGQIRAIEEVMRTERAGVNVGVMKGNELVPSADLALSIILAPGFWPECDVDRSTALHFFHRDTIVLDGAAPRGYVALKFKGLRIGFVKNLGTRCNNLHPKSRRILMDIG